MLLQQLVGRAQTGNQAGALTAFCGVAVTCWEIATGLMPVRGHLTPPTKDECPREVAKLIADLMRRDPHSRPSAASAYRSAHHLCRCRPSDSCPETVVLCSVPRSSTRSSDSCTLVFLFQLLFCPWPCIHLARWSTLFRVR